MDEPSTESVVEIKLYCWMDSGRVCGSDCVAFDRRGAVDTTGKHTTCKLCNHLDGVCRSNVSIARFLEAVMKRSIPGTNVPPPPVGGFG